MSKPNARRPTRGAEAQTPLETGRIAQELGEVAKGAGAVGARVTDAKRRLRNAAIIAAVQAGEPVGEVAKGYELTTRQVRRIVKDFNSIPSALDQRPMELVQNLVRAYQGTVADFEAMSAYYQDTHPNVALGAKRGAIDTRERLQALLELVGKLPDNLQLFRQEAEMRRIGDLMVLKLAELEAGHSTAVEVREYWERLLQTPPGETVIEASSSWVDERPAEGEAA